jgi:hypothetical protein
MGLGRGVALVVSIIGDTSGLKSALGDAGKDVKGFGGISLATAAKVTVVGGAVAVAAEALWGLASAASADRTEQQKLEQAIRAAGAATADSTAQVEAAIAAGQARAFTDSETRAGLQSLVTATGDVQKATELLATAQDIARFANVDLATASDAVAKAYAGNDKALRTLIPGMEKGATAVDTIANAHKFAAGQADIYADSAEGMSKRAGDKLGELGETIGEALLPVMDALWPLFETLIDLLAELITAVLPVIKPLLAAVGEAFKILAGFIRGAVDAVKSLIQWVEDLLRPLGEALDMLADLNPFAANTTKRVFHFSGGATGAANPALGGPVVFNIYGDPATIESTVVRALDNYTRRNGLAPLVGLER